MEYIPPGFTPNYRRAYSVFAYLIGAHNDGEFPYTEAAFARRPQDQLTTEVRQPNGLFYTTHMMRGLRDSTRAAQQIVKLHARWPEMFDPAKAARLSESQIQGRLEKCFENVPKHQHYAKAWKRNSELLAAWGGDIRNVYEGVTTEAEVRARIVNKQKYHLPPREQGFFGFQAKMCSLLTYFLMAEGHIPRISMSPPIDFHHMRIMVGTRILPLPPGRYSPRAVEKLADRVGRRYLDKHYEMDPVFFADLMFILSRDACARAVKEENPDWSNTKTVARYRRTCGNCPIEDKCHCTVRHESYYTKNEESSERVIHIVPRPRPPR